HSALLSHPSLPLTLPPPPRSSLFPYTTLFRSLSESYLYLLARWDRFMDALTVHVTLSAMALLIATLICIPWASGRPAPSGFPLRSEEHTSELQSRENLVCRLLLEKKKNVIKRH